MVIVREKKESDSGSVQENKNNKPTADMLLDYDYMIHKALARAIGLRPLTRDQWQKNLYSIRQRSFRLIKALSDMG